MTANIPDDLIPLSRWTKVLGMKSRQCVRLAEKGEFPQIYMPKLGVFRVSDSAVRRWLEARSATALAARRRRVLRAAAPRPGTRPILIRERADEGPRRGAGD